MDREQKIIRTSILGIAANVLLAGFKAAVGLAANSVAIVLDAVNNLSDALSSLITIIGTRLAQKAPDKQHPLGYGRVEYLSATVIAVIVLYAGITSLVESVKKIIAPETPDYTPYALIIVAAAVAVKILLGTHVKRVGRQVASDALVASGSDAMFDAILSASTLVAAILYLTLRISLEAWLGAVISVVIIKSGFEMLRDTISEILGERVDSDLARSVKAAVTSFPEVRGAYDLVIHNYGPNQLVGSVHIEIPDVMTVEEADVLERRITQKVSAETGVIMTGISVYSVNTRNDAAAEMERTVRVLAETDPYILQLHGFYVDETSHTLRFDIVIDFDAPDRGAVLADLCRRVGARYPDYTVHITPDTDLSD